ncbi:MAG: phosphoribosylformylglycinamidine synthase [Chloroflexi bacterium]|nr:phosphoribosylformylglycinamidine synthase [Chloroflexota bacterium]|tara:strand:+ start:2854 stop:3105 length:252 start_codon:yes stop_codon:yes gene_type:complete
MEETFSVRVDVMLRQEINDPQGLAIANGLRELGYHEVSKVRAGKRIDLQLRAENAEDAITKADSMASSLLANLVIEDYSITLI